MRIAFLTPFSPFPSDTGGKIRSFNIVSELASKHELHLITVYGESTFQQKAVFMRMNVTVCHFPASHKGYSPSKLAYLFSSMPHHVESFFDSATAHKINDYIASIKPDLIIADEIVMVPYVEHLTSIPRILAIQNIDYLTRLENSQFQRLGKTKLQTYTEYLKLKSYSQKVFNLDWHSIIVCSEDDARIVKQVNAEVSTIVVPNGVNVDFFKATTSLVQPVESLENKDHINLLFVGSMFYYPNIDAIKYFFESIFPLVNAILPNLDIWIVGHHPPEDIRSLEGRYGNIHVTGSVSDVRSYYELADIVIVPLRLGGGTSLKVLEAIAMNKPVITTSKGVRGLALENNKDVLIADTSDAFSKAIINVALDRDLRRKLTDTRESTLEKFSWATLIQPILKACETINARQEVNPSAPSNTEDLVEKPQKESRKPLRILCLSNLYPPYILGGYEILAHNTMNELRARGHEVYIGTGHGAQFADDASINSIFDLNLDEKENVFLRHLKGYMAQLKEYLFHPGNYKNTRRLLKEVQPDIVSVWNMYLVSVAPMIAARHQHYPIVTHLTDQWLLYNTKNIIRLKPGTSKKQVMILKLIRRLIQPILYWQVKPNNLIIPSQSLIQTYVETGFDERSFELIPHGINTTMFPYVERPMSPDSTFRLVFVGQLWEGKGPQILLRALGIVKRQHETLDFHLDIYGTGDKGFMDHMEDIIKQEQIEDNVSFRGTVPHNELYEVYKTHDLLIFPSIWNEPFALTPLEAMSTGLAVIASDAGGTKEAINHEYNGLIVPAGNEEQLANAIVRLIEDPVLCREFGKKGSEVAHDYYSFTKMVDRVEDTYYKILREQSSR